MPETCNIVTATAALAAAYVDLRERCGGTGDTPSAPCLAERLGELLAAVRSDIAAHGWTADDAYPDPGNPLCLDAAWFVAAQAWIEHIACCYDLCQCCEGRPAQSNKACVTVSGFASDVDGPYELEDVGGFLCGHAGNFTLENGDRLDLTLERDSDPPGAYWRLRVLVSRLVDGFSETIKLGRYQRTAASGTLDCDVAGQYALYESGLGGVPNEIAVSAEAGPC